MNQYINKPTPAFVAASWAALFAGGAAYGIGLFNADMLLNEKGYYLVLILYGLFSAVSLQKIIRDKIEGMHVTHIYYGLCWASVAICIALLAVGVQPRDRDAADDAAQHGQERGLAVVALDGKVAGRIPLRRGHAVHHTAVFACAARDLDAELLHSVNRHIHVGAALVGGQYLDAALGLHQRRGKQQTADELAGHVAGQGEPAGTQPSKDRDALGRLLKLQALALKQHLVDGLRAVKQPPRAGKAHLLGRQAEQRDHEPQC